MRENDCNCTKYNFIVEKTCKSLSKIYVFLPKTKWKLIFSFKFLKEISCYVLIASRMTSELSNFDLKFLIIIGFCCTKPQWCPQLLSFLVFSFNKSVILHLNLTRKHTKLQHFGSTWNKYGNKFYQIKNDKPKRNQHGNTLSASDRIIGCIRCTRSLYFSGRTWSRFFSGGILMD